MTSDRPDRKAISPFEAKETVIELAGKGFDPKMVGAFAACFRLGLTEVPEVMVELLGTLHLAMNPESGIFLLKIRFDVK